MKFSPKPYTLNPIPKHLCWLLMLFLANLAFSQTAYVITGGGTEFTATKGEETVETGTIQTVIDAIKSDASGVGVSIQFGDNNSELDIGTANVTFSGGTSGTDWGKITLLGKITSASTSSNGAIYMSNGASVESMADIRKTNNYAIRNSSTGTLTISGGNISATGYTVYNSSSGAIIINYGTISVIGSNGYAICNGSSGTISVNGGTISAIGSSDYAIYNGSSGTININDGAISATGYSGRAIYNYSSGTVNISGGSISATGSNGYTIYNYNGTINISGGTIFAAESSGYAVYSVYNYYTTGNVILGNSPNITGIIRTTAGTLSTITSEENIFTPGTKIYTLEFDSYSRDMLVVENGANYLSNFTLKKPDLKAELSLATNGNDLVLAFTNGYTVSVNGTSYTIAIGNEFVTVQQAVNSIRDQANGEDCSIQLGNGVNELDIGNENIEFNGSGTPSWGKIILLGKITSTNTSGVIRMSSEVFLESMADIRTTASYAIYNFSTGVLAISGGTILANNYAIYNSSSGMVTINGGTISATGSSGRTIYNNSTGEINIVGGTISATGSSGYAVYNVSTGTVNIVGGTISAIVSNGYAVYNNSSGSIILGNSPNITGKIRATAGTLSVIVENENIFAPNNNIYTLELSISNSMIAVANGANYLSSFILETPDLATELILATSGDDIIITVVNGYNLTTNGLFFTITRGTGGFATIQSLINSIKEQANGEDVSIQFGNGDNELDIRVEYIEFNGSGTPSWGKITLYGRITSSNTSYGAIYISNGVSLESWVDIRGTNYYAIRSLSTGTLTISGGTISAVYYPVLNSSSGTITINGGTISATGSGYAIYNSSSGTVNINGGIVSSTGSSGRAIYNASTGTVNINGGTISAIDSSGYAVYNASTGSIILGNSPDITGKIRITTGTLSVIASNENVFAPDSKIYMLELSISSSMVVVANGANYSSNFTLVENTDLDTELSLAANGNDLVLAVANGYSISSNGTIYTIIKGGSEFATVQLAINSIKTQANGSDISIQFGNGINELDVGAEYIELNGSGTPSWGKITLLGKINSRNSVYGAIYISSGISIESFADVINKTSDAISYAIRNVSNGTLTISGGTISATNTSSSNTVYNSYAIYNGSSGILNINSGTVSATGSSSHAVYNASIGTVNINGGTISADNYAVYNASTGGVILGNSPDITGKIRTATGTLSVIAEGGNVFVPSGKTYMLELSISSGMIAVTNGTNYLSSFMLETPDLGAEFSLAASGNDIVLTLINGYSFSVSGTTYTITIGAGHFTTIQQAINSIKEQANGSDVSIQFGNGIDELNIGAESVTFDGSGNPGWGKITLLGKITSSSTSYVGTIIMSNGVSVESMVDIAKIGYYAINNSSTGTLTISGGTISANSIAIYNSSTGAVNIVGGTISATSAIAVYNASVGSINITGGTISAVETSYAIYNVSTGKVIIGKSPDITGRIMTTTGTLEVIASGDNVFAPNSKIYTLQLTSYSGGVVVVKNGADFVSNFFLADDVWGLIASGSDLVTNEKIAGAIVATPALNAITDTSITINAVAAPENGQEVEYAISTNDTAPLSGWQTSLTFTDLSANTTYYIFARAKGDNNYEPGIVSAALEITTLEEAPIESPCEGEECEDTPIRISQIASGQIGIQAINGGILIKNLPSNSKVELYNLQGKQVYSGNSGNSQILEIRNQAKGMYIVKAGTQKFKVSITN